MKKIIVASLVLVVSAVSFFAALVVGDNHLSQWEAMAVATDSGAGYETPLWINAWTFLSLAGLIVGIALLVWSLIRYSRSAKPSSSVSL